MNKQWLNILRKNIGGKRKTIFLKEHTNGIYKSIRAMLADGTKVASIDLVMRPRKKSLTIGSVSVRAGFEGKGISTDLFNKAMDIGRKNNRNKVLGMEVLHPAQINIRSKFDSIFKFTKTGKTRSRKVNSLNAMSIISENRRGNFTGSISAETKIPKKMIKRIRIRGRWLTIKRKK